MQIGFLIHDEFNCFNARALNCVTNNLHSKQIHASLKEDGMRGMNSKRLSAQTLAAECTCTSNPGAGAQIYLCVRERPLFCALFAI